MPNAKLTKSFTLPAYSYSLIEIDGMGNGYVYTNMEYVLQLRQNKIHGEQDVSERLYCKTCIREQKVNAQNHHRSIEYANHINLC